MNKRGTLSKALIAGAGPPAVRSSLLYHFKYLNRQIDERAGGSTKPQCCLQKNWLKLCSQLCITHPPNRGTPSAAGPY